MDTTPRTSSEPDETPATPTNLSTLLLRAHFDEGSGPAIVMLHGINSDGGDWRWRVKRPTCGSRRMDARTTRPGWLLYAGGLLGIVTALAISFGPDFGHRVGDVGYAVGHADDQVGCQSASLGLLGGFLRSESLTRPPRPVRAGQRLCLRS